MNLLVSWLGARHWSGAPPANYYAAFVRDPNGNRIEAVTRQPEEQS